MYLNWWDKVFGYHAFNFIFKTFINVPYFNKCLSSPADAQMVIIC